MDAITTIYETVHGSHAYGLAREGSDLDVKGVIVGPKVWYFGFRGGPEQIELGTGVLGHAHSTVESPIACEASRPTGRRAAVRSGIVRSEVDAVHVAARFNETIGPRVSVEPMNEVSEGSREGAPSGLHAPWGRGWRQPLEEAEESASAEDASRPTGRRAANEVSEGSREGAPSGLHAPWGRGWRQPLEETDAKDHVAFELRKLLRLLVNANPTVLELLFVDVSLHRVLTAEGARLLDFRERFLTRKVGETFGGYALGQLRRIQTHRKWLLDPPKEPPTRVAFGLPERPAIPKDQLGAAETLLARGVFGATSGARDESEPSHGSEPKHSSEASDPSEVLRGATSFLELLAREKRFEAAKKHWQQYQQWKRERNEARAALEARHGYDTKHAMHLVRLQRMGLEILTRGEVIVTRPDRDELLAIRDGAWTFERLLEEAERMDRAIRDAVSTSALPTNVDEDAVEALGVELVERVLASRT
ncbi:MAG: nucleotidyltransferase domain-containing protein [Myxococcota bacterium]|jgi:hypothetical protein|nr:nucleotidyltransferase domain-containing protein [Myxococcota bacterium]